MEHGPEDLHAREHLHAIGGVGTHLEVALVRLERYAVGAEPIGRVTDVEPEGGIAAAVRGEAEQAQRVLEAPLAERDAPLLAQRGLRRGGRGRQEDERGEESGSHTPRIPRVDGPRARLHTRPVLASSSAALPLRALPVLFVDCQSTGATPAHGSLLEVAWARGDAPVASALVALPEGASIPPYVRRITGLDEGQLAGALAPGEVWRRLARDAQAVAREAGSPRAPAVIHFASFELRFLLDLHASHGEGVFPLDALCTHEIARRLLPDLPRRGLRALSGYFGAPAGELRRSEDHALATRAVWRAMSALLEERGVRTIDELRAWMLATEVARPLARGWPMPASERAGLPDAPGVYRMRRVDGSLLYVGKASSLKRRVASYFTRKRKIPERTVEMLTQARRLEVTRTETTLEAALLEHDEIKAHAPPYNVALRASALALAPSDRALRGAAWVPVIDPRVFEGLDLLAAALRDGTCADTARALDVPPVWAPEAAAFVEGAALFAARHPVALDVPSLMALGSALYRREEEDDEERPDGWTPERVAEWIEDRWIRAAHAQRRGRWLAMLREASVSWSEGDRRRLLVIADGEIVHRAYGDEVPMPPGARRSIRERASHMDRASYDRLRVLTTELRRLHAEGADPIVRCAPAGLVRGPAMARLLARV